MAKNNFCPFCGASVSLNDAYETRFCPFCGKELPSDGQEEQQTAAQQAAAEPAVPPEVETPAPASPASPVQKTDPLFYPEQQTKSEKRGQTAGAAPEKRPGGIRIKSHSRWMVAIIAWALAWSALVYAAEEAFDFSPALIIGLILCGSMPLWYPRFHPDAGKKKGVVLKWTLIMIAILVACFFLVEELA